MSKQRELIERIRREEFGIGVELGGEAKTVVDNMKRKYQNLLSTVADDLNSKDSHFILELIQNADDNNYARGVDPSLSFSIDGHRLVVKNNEVGFQEKNVRALCSAGESSKKSEKRKGYIGEKGIGFKSIFKVTDSPEIHSGGFHFRFDRSNPEDLLGYVVPHWHEPDSKEDEQTTLVIPAKRGHRFTASTLIDVSETLLLFLQKLRRLDVADSDGLNSYQRHDIGSITTLMTNKPSAAPVRQDFLRKTFKVDVTDIHEPKREGIKETEIVLAFPMSDSGEASPIPGCATYAFLPIRDFGFNFYIQADFVLASSREAIHEELVWNIRLRDAIAKAFVEAVDELKQWPELANTYLKFLPTQQEIHDPFFAPVIKQLIDRLKEVECIPVMGGGWKRPSEVLLAPEKIRELFPTEDALRIFQKGYPKDSFVLPRRLSESLGIKDLMTTDVASVFAEHSDWIKGRTLDWMAKFYAYLAQPAVRSGYVKLLAKSHCIPLEGGALTAPTDGSIFFPLSEGRRYGFEHELAILDAELLRVAADISPDVLHLFLELGVRQDNPVDLIQSHILKLHAHDKWMDSDKEALIGHVCYIKDRLPQYLRSMESKGQQETAALAELKNGLFIGTKSTRDGQWIFNHIHELYMAKEYQPEFDLERLLGSGVQPEMIVSSQYLDSPLSRKGVDGQLNDIKEWRDFFSRLGVNTSPRVVREASGNVVCSSELNCLLKSDKSSVRRITLETLDRHWNTYPGATTYQARVGRNWYTYPTGLISTLKAAQAPTRQKAQVALSATYVDSPDTRAVLDDSVVFVHADLHNPTFLDACGVTYKVDAAACLKRLRQMKSGGVRSAEQIRKIYRCLENLWDKERPAIEVAFSQSSLIRVGIGDSARWVYPSETCWKPTNNKFLDRQYPPLSVGPYRDFHGFFVKKLKVSEGLSLENWVDALKRFDDIDVDDRPEFALSIYRRLSQAIDSHNRSGGQLIVPDWVSDLDDDSLLLNRHGEMVGKSEHFYADDRPEISMLFDDEEEIAFFNVPANQLPSVGSLLDALKIQRLSDAIEVEASGDAIGTIHNRLTARLRDMLIPIARITYSQSHAAFEHAIKSGLFYRLSKAVVLEIESLTLTVTLGEWSREMSGLSAWRNSEILLDTSTRSKHDYVAMEVGALLKLRKGESAHISRVLMADCAEDANDYLEIQKIPDLPHEEMQELMSSIERSVEPGIKAIDEMAAGTDSENHGEPNRAYGGAVDTTDEPAEIHAAQRGDQVGRVGGPGKTRETSEQSSLSSQTAASGVSSNGREQTSNSSIAPAASGYPPADTVKGQSRSTGNAKPNNLEESTRTKSKPATRSGRLLSYAEPTKTKDDTAGGGSLENPSLVEHKQSVEQAAIQQFIEKAAGQWREVKEMPPNNPGYDFFAEAFDGNHEFVEIKGQSGAWTEEGVALTPTELRAAAQYGERYWLCVVEFALDEARRRLWLVQNPFGKTDQFRFDRGWQDVAEKRAESPMRPEAGHLITIPEMGKVKILEVIGNGLLAKIKVELNDKSTAIRTYSPAVMKLSVD